MSLLLLFGSKESPLEASVAATSSATGTLVVTRALAGTAAGAATAGATLNATVALTATAAGVSAVNGDLLAVRLLEGTVSGSSSCTGDLTALVLLEGTSAGQSSITGSMRYSGLSLSDVYLEVTGTPVFNNDADPADNYLGSWTLPCTVRSGGKADCILETGMAAVKWGHHNQVGETTEYTGGLLLTSDLSTAPYLDVFTVDSGNSPYPWETSAITPRVRLGNLNGVAGLTSDEWGIALGTDLSDNTSAAKSLIASDQQFTMKNIDIAMYKSTKQTVSIEADGDMKLGTDISSPATTSFTFDASTGTVSLTGYMATGADLPWGDITGLPAPLDTINGAGLYLTSSYLGYWDGDSWNAYIKSDGTFRFGGATDYFDFDGTNIGIHAASGAVTIGKDGIDITSGTASGNRISWYESTTERFFIQADPTGEVYTFTIKAIDPGSGIYPSSAHINLIAARPGDSLEGKIDLTPLGASVTGYVGASNYLCAAKALSSGGTPDRNYEGNVEANGNSDAFGLFRSKNRAYLGANVYRNGATWYYDDGTGVHAYLFEVNEPGGAWNWYRSTATGNGGGSISAWTTAMSLSRVGELSVASKFGCNGSTAQGKYALNADISGTADGTYDATEQNLINSLVSQVNKLRAALVANGICS